MNDMPVIIDDITNGQEHHPISLINSLDNEGVPENFQYVPNNFLSPETSYEDSESVPQPCTCLEVCQVSSCSCDSIYGFGFIASCLKKEFISTNAKPVIECSSLCTCAATCPNRVTQHGISYKLRIYKTENKGFTVETLDEIPELAYVCDYAGEVIGIEEARRRFLSQKLEDSNYIFVLREHCSKSDIVTVIDPTSNGNIGRFLNHSCSPNLIMVPVRSDCMVPKLCFFAVRFIAPFEELTYDYGSTFSFQPDKNVSEKLCPKTILKKCYCLSDNCSGYLPFCADL